MAQTNIQSRLEIFNIKDRTRRRLYSDNSHFEAPNWSRDGKFLIINRDGLLYEVRFNDPVPKLINTEFANRCNNDHGISPDGSEIVISHHDAAHHHGSIIYRLPLTGGTPQRVTELWPSYWHGWSPDGQSMAYVAGREGHQDLKIYSIHLASGVENQLTFGPGLDDGPDYSPCGRYIYFNGFRAGKMQIWRMDSDGSNPIQLIDSAHSDWFPHPSPNGQHVIFIRYLEDQGQSHPFGRDVQIMLLDLTSGEVSALTDVFFGGQGSLNVPCWSPDSSEFAFVSYRQI